MSDENNHANAVAAQLRQAARGGDLPDEEPGEGESNDGAGGTRPVPPQVPPTPEEDSDE